jgi:hypothetical protein
MFEELEEEERGKREERKRLLRMTAYLVGAVLVVGAIIYIASRGHSKTSQAVKSLAAARQTVPDPVKDLKIVHAIMGKDPSGLRVMWSVQLRNKSAVYTYSDIQYEARFIGPDGSMRGANRDTIKTSIAPGEEERIPPFIDGIYDANASTYQFVLLGATSSAQ